MYAIVSPSDIKKWLDAGIAAVRSGDNVTARTMLMKVLDADERNEMAWLWLGAVGETAEDRRICLENVLELNPDNAVAQKGLARLDSSAGAPAEEASTEQALSSKPIDSPPAIRRGANKGKSETTAAPRRAHASYEDVWDSDEDICAYCAAVVTQTAKWCPNCGRSLAKLSYRYPATSVLHMYWVLLLSLVLVLGFQAIFKLQIEQRNTDAILHALMAASLVLLTVGVLLRLFVAHILATLILVFALVLGGYDFLVPFDPSALSMANSDPAFRGFTTGFFNRLGLLLEFIHVALAGAALFYATMRASPEFERVEEHNFARTKKGLHTATDYHVIARRLRQEGKWASAVLHWQRAAAIEPNKVVYQRNLAQAYLHLGFTDRGIDLLEAASRLPMQPVMRSEMERLLARARHRVGERRDET